MKLCLNLEDVAQRKRYHSALRRVRDVSLVDEPAEAEAVVTEELSGLTEKPTLWVCQGKASMPIPGYPKVIPAMPWRFRPSVQVMIHKLRSGKLGKPGLLRVHRWHANTDILADLDLALWLFSEEPRTKHVVQCEGYLQIHLGFASGGMAIIDHAHEVIGKGYESLTLIGSTGATYADDHRNVQLLLGPTSCTGLTTGEGDVVTLSAMLEDFVASVREPQQATACLAEFARAKRLLESMNLEEVVA